MDALDTNRTVLVIDDDAHVRELVRTRLEANNFRVLEADTGERGMTVFDDAVDVVVIDVGLPGIDGFSVLRRIRASSAVPIVMLTASDGESDRVLALDIGADDYIIKPFLPRELVARVRAVLRRTQRPDTVEDPDTLRFGNVTVDLHAFEVQRDGQTLALTNLEFDLLTHLVKSPRQVFSRDQLLLAVWEVEPGWQDPATVTEHIHRLRRHLETDVSSPRYIVTVRGAGYRFDP